MSPTTSPTESSKVDRRPEPKLPLHWILLAYFALLGLNVWLLWFLPDASALEKVSFVLSIVGVYSLALNFSSGSNVSPESLDDLTSPSLRGFAAGSFRVVAVTFLLASLFVRGFPPRRRGGSACCSSCSLSRWYRRRSSSRSC